MRVCFVTNLESHARKVQDHLLNFVKLYSTNCTVTDILNTDRASMNQFDLSSFSKSEYDLLVVFDVEFLARRLAENDDIPLVLYFPMVENTMQLGKGFWTPFEYNKNIRVVNFNAMMHRRLMMWNVNSFRFQYFPEPDLLSSNYHCELYTASKNGIGIDIGALDAMANGLCVLSPDIPGLNEYIVDRVSGIITEYEPSNPPGNDSIDIARIGCIAAQYARDNYWIWMADLHARLRELMFSSELINPSDFREIGGYCWSSPERVAAYRCVKPAHLEYVERLKVSIAVVCKNSGKHLASTLDTIISQTYSNVELLVIDGASTDNTHKILEDYQEKIDTYISEPDQGPYDGMNKAAKLATGHYIIFMNAGDFFQLPTSLSDAMQSVFGSEGSWISDPRRSDKNDLPEFVLSNHIYLQEDGASALRLTKDFEVTWQQLSDGDLSDNWLGGIPCHQSTLTRRDWLAERNYDLSFTIAADHHFMFASRSSGARFVHSARLMAMYSGGGLSSQCAAECHKESYRIAHSVSDTPAVRDFYSNRFGAEVLSI